MLKSSLTLTELKNDNCSSGESDHFHYNYLKSDKWILSSALKDFHNNP